MKTVGKYVVKTSLIILLFITILSSIPSFGLPEHIMKNYLTKNKAHSLEFL